MKNKLSLILVLLLSISICFGQTKKQKKALEVGQEAIIKIDAGEFEEGIKLLKKAQKMDPENIIYQYEIGYAYYMQKDYEKAIKQVESFLDHKNVTANHFQLLGNCYDYLKKPDEAIKAYQRGIDKFPNAGKLYTEQGVVEYFRENYDKAIELWEKGIEVEPSYPSNYYWLGKIFSYTEERIWAVMYGETFVNLERGSKRTEEMSKILHDTFKDAIYIESDSTGGVRFTQSIIMSTEGEFKMPFSMEYAMGMTLALTPHTMAKEKEINIPILNQIRKDFVNHWFKEKKQKNYSNVIIEYHKKLKDVGHFESYNYWLLMKGDENLFVEWYQKNTDKFNQFVEWYQENPLEMDKSNYISRLKN
ncbi:tetratricopeptide repeat protein [Aureivirga sp. CE67]|uniref:tetratricopeptide repeat protein n=1 Tax=Aureivirga sp. CE67 TaxID=1788983 RepID=UPI0018CBA2FC|nr:tetratricopeptide repeat protein [Aureivirga sp. CE67]